MRVGPGTPVGRGLLLVTVLASVGAALPGCAGASQGPDAASDGQPGPADLATPDLPPGPVDATALPQDLIDPATCKAGFAGCTEFVDATADQAERVITATSFAYTPKCLRVRAGQTVTFRGDLVFHPLGQACGPSVPLTASGGTERAFVLPVAGRLGYYCLDHGNPEGQAMAGAIDVLP